MPEPKRVFLDTSIHMAWFKGKAFQTWIRKCLGQFEWRGTSSYCITEFGNNLLRYFQHVVSYLRKYGSIETTLSHIAHTLPSRYYSQWQVFSLTTLLQHFGDDVDTAIASLESLMLRHKTQPGIACDDVVRGTKCYYAEHGVVQKKDGSYAWEGPKCKTHRKPYCEIDKYFTRNRENFIALSDHIETHLSSLSGGRREEAKQLGGFVKTIRLAAIDPAVLLEYDNCKALADAIIAVDSIGYDSFLTQNIQESIVLCAFFKQHLFYKSNRVDEDIIHHDLTGTVEEKGTVPNPVE